MIYVVCWVEGNTRNWVEVSGKDAMWRKVSELNASGFDTPENDIVVGEITEDTGFDTPEDDIVVGKITEDTE